MRWLCACALLLVLVAPVGALDTTTRPVGPVLEWSSASLDRFADNWIHVKFVEGSDVSLSDGRFVAGDGRDLAAVNDVVAGAVQLRRTFPGDREKYQAWKARGEAASGRTGPDLSLWFDVRLATDQAALAGTINALNALDAVEIAHPAPVCEPAVVMSDGGGGGTVQTLVPTPDFTSLQNYLYDPPVGLDAPAAWAHPGGRGEGMRFIDVERGWFLHHEDFDPLRLFYVGGVDNGTDDYDHGTAVLGEVVGWDNGYGITGFANRAQWGGVAYDVDEWPEIPQYFLEAAEALRPGDVWLIEIQMYPPGRDATPMEWVQVNYDVIWTSCWALEVVCVEAGANGSQDLDDPDWNGVFDRNVRDSGAILVAAGTPYSRVAESFTNYGSRMDVHAWGSQIVSTGYGDLQGGDNEHEYTSSFGGTSGASPMITGSALCLQGISRARYDRVMTPVQLRQLLHETGIDHLDPNREIGPRPDLAAAIEQYILTTPAPQSYTASGLTITSAVTPFDTGTEIRFRQPRQGAVTMSVYDVMGRRVRRIDLPAGAAGARAIRWDGQDGAGREVGSGVYLFRLVAGGEAATGRLVKIR